MMGVCTVFSQNPIALFPIVLYTSIFHSYISMIPLIDEDIWEVSNEVLSILFTGAEY